MFTTMTLYHVSPLCTDLFFLIVAYCLDSTVFKRSTLPRPGPEFLGLRCVGGSVIDSARLPAHDCHPPSRPRSLTTSGPPWRLVCAEQPSKYEREATDGGAVSPRQRG